MVACYICGHNRPATDEQILSEVVVGRRKRQRVSHTPFTTDKVKGVVPLTNIAIPLHRLIGVSMHVMSTILLQETGHGSLTADYLDSSIHSTVSVVTVTLRASYMTR